MNFLSINESIHYLISCVLLYDNEGCSDTDTSIGTAAGTA